MINKVCIPLHETQNHAEQRVFVARRTPKMVPQQVCNGHPVCQIFASG